MLTESEQEDIQSIINQPEIKPSDQTIITLFLEVTSQNHSNRAKAFTALALIFQHRSAESCDFLRIVLEDSFLHSTQSSRVFIGLKVISAFLLLSPQHALHFILSKGFLTRLAESVIDLLSLDQSLPSKKNIQHVDLNYAFSEFIALALNHKQVRDMIHVDWSGCVRWLTQISMSTTSSISISARCSASLALIKLRLTSDLEQKTMNLPTLTDLTRVVLNSFLKDDQLINSTSIEALALVSHKSSARKILMNQSELFLRLIKAQSMLNHNKDKINKDTMKVKNENIQSDTSIEYGIATILANISSYKVIKTDEDEAADQLKKLAKRSRAQQPVSSTQNENSVRLDEEQEEEEIDDQAVFEWIQGTLERNNDLMDIVGWLVKSESKQVKRSTGKLILNLVERQQLRGMILQCGGGRMLMKIIATLNVSEQYKLNTQSNQNNSRKNDDANDLTLAPADLHIVQALAKILITTNPLLIFGPSNDSPILLSTIKPLTTLFIHPSSTLLQTFEALMALTNLSSLGGRIPHLIAESDRVLNRLEECMIGVRTAENHLICRASTELICNISSTESILNHFSRQKTSSISRLHLLIALSSSDDIPTALAASGSLAIMTENSTKVCQIILTENKLSQSLSRIVTDAMEEGEKSNIGLLFRLMSLLANLSEFQLSSSSSSSDLLLFNSKLLDCLTNFLKLSSNSVITPNSNIPNSELNQLIQITQSLMKSVETIIAKK